ncbi:hypothetical protein [Gandjariella thermophila]|uniref:Uncharacterized protein n=1 Tax=Gandjariella thermophila TaxID=1931992 RepID=A0A4D4J8N8_9PSEU|nr:hypothetical protein [Gandjariella thermophila]GDY31028.1 hypothetical protein GTS_26610 [Gandjariella thermophila]
MRQPTGNDHDERLRARWRAVGRLLLDALAGAAIMSGYLPIPAEPAGGADPYHRGRTGETARHDDHDAPPARRDAAGADGE